ncbi:hypothetical protein TrRE_jg12760 [Triparma retinervis]|uniref:Uncharacterized protein n=1 Tax=Triparma retinervis TaxID=2557542 RepID=A0A9W7DWK6_9STRA|nr:hypothetical protein TrRE_jg12760 [Triparma retinervis]
MLHLPQALLQINSQPLNLLYLPPFYLFSLAVTIQPFIVVGFWGLVFPYSSQCDYRCGTVHGAGFVLIYTELMLTKIVPSPSLLPLVICYPALWAVTQVAWIYTDHKPDYEVLPMDNWASLALTLGSMAFFVATFYGAGRLCGWRDKRWGFPGGVSGRGGPPASKYFNDGGNNSGEDEDVRRAGLLMEEEGTINF